jgi:hypothetical protein
VIDPLHRRASTGEKPDYAGLLTFAGVSYTQDAAHLAGVAKVTGEILSAASALRRRKYSTGKANDKEER